MTSKTEKDFIHNAAVKINLIASGESLDASLYVDLQAEYLAFHLWLKKEFGPSILWGKDQIPEDQFAYLTSMFAGRLIGVFPTSESVAKRVLSNAATSETYYREILARKRLKPVEGMYF